jgi:hypothetical protein
MKSLAAVAEGIPQVGVVLEVSFLVKIVGLAFLGLPKIAAVPQHFTTLFKHRPERLWGLDAYGCQPLRRDAPLRQLFHRWPKPRNGSCAEDRLGAPGGGEPGRLLEPPVRERSKNTRRFEGRRTWPCWSPANGQSAAHP